MRTGTQVNRISKVFGRAIGPVTSIVILALFCVSVPAVAQQGGNQAGLVVQFGDGSLYIACVDLGPSGQATGEEVLRASGLTASVDYGSGYGGGTVCKIADDGCDFPAEKCFCQCTMKPGDPCIYWSYFHLIEGAWRYSPQGASRYVVKPGDVEGWAWGLGSSETGVAPPTIPFEQICPPASQVPTPRVAVSTPTREPLPQPSVTVSKAPAPSPPASATPSLERTSPATQTSTPAENASIFNEEPPISAENEPSTKAAAVQDSGDETTSSNSFNYIIFGGLVVALLGALIFLRVR